MTARVLPLEEWPRLSTTESFGLTMGDGRQFWQHLPSDGSVQVFVVEDGGEIVGTWSLLQMWHAECLFVAESHRGRSAVGKALLSLMQASIAQKALQGVCTGAQSGAVEMMLQKVGAMPLPYVPYYWPSGRTTIPPTEAT